MEIFDYVGLKIAMGNATPELKAKADYVTGTVEEDGIFNALEELGLVEKELHFPQLDLDTVEGPVVTIKTNHGDSLFKHLRFLMLKRNLNVVAGQHQLQKLMLKMVAHLT